MRRKCWRINTLKEVAASIFNTLDVPFARFNILSNTSSYR